MQRRLSSGAVDELVAQYACGATITELVRSFDIHRTTVMSHLDDRKVPRRSAVRKMTDELVASAALRYGESQSLATVAAEFEVHARTLAREFQLAELPVRPRNGWPNRD